MKIRAAPVLLSYSQLLSAILSYFQIRVQSCSTDVQAPVLLQWRGRTHDTAFLKK
jgi:hypothetical protein